MTEPWHGLSVPAMGLVDENQIDQDAEIAQVVSRSPAWMCRTYPGVLELDDGPARPVPVRPRRCGPNHLWGVAGAVC